MPDELLANAVRRRKRIVAEDPDDCRHVLKARIPGVRLPVEEARRLDADLLRDFALQ